MQTTSQTWKALWAGGNARLETKAVINGTEYTEISNPSINRALMQNGCSIGNAVSATCIFAVRTNASIPKSAEVVIKFRLTDGTTTSEWLNAGTFYIAHRSRDPVTGVLALTCYDALLKTNTPMPKLMPWTTKGGAVMRTKGGDILTLTAHYPRRMVDVLSDLEILLTGQIAFDPNNTVETGPDYVITEDDMSAGMTINQVLKLIAAANGGNWIMSPDNKLRLVPVVSAAGASGATENVVDVVAITQKIGTSRTSTITGIRYYAGAEPFVIGTETGLVIEANTSADIASDLAEKLVGMTYQAYEIKSAIYDPAAELGDYVRAGANGEVSAVLCAETSTYGLAYRGDISAPEIGELSDEYPYVSFDQGQSVELAEAKAYADAKVQTLDNELTQQEIFDRLTDGGQTQGIMLEEALSPALGANSPKLIYLNLDYAKVGRLTADQIDLSDYDTTIKVPNEYDASSLFSGQEIDANGWVVNSGGSGDILVCKITNAQEYVGKQIIISGTSKDRISGGETVREMSSGIEEAEVWIAAAYGQVNADGTLVGPTADKDGEKFTTIVTIEEGVVAVSVYFTCSGVKMMTADVDIASSMDVRYASNIGISYKGLQVGRFVVDRSGNANINGGVYVNGSAAASGTYTTADGKTVTVTNGIITAIT